MKNNSEKTKGLTPIKQKIKGKVIPDLSFSPKRKNAEIKVISDKKNILNKRRSLLVSNFEIKKKELSKEYVFNFLSKNPSSRALSEIRNVAEYLSKNYQYFTKLKNEDSQLKVEKLTKICKLEKFFKGESIIKFGEIGDKFYIVLEGVVEIYTPKYVEISEIPIDFINNLEDMKDIDGNDLRYKRVKNKNNLFFKNVPKDLTLLRKEFEHIQYEQTFIMEEDEKRGEYGEGFSFGDIALIKKAPRNASIKAKENCVLLTIGKDDYTKAILEFQKRKLSKEIDVFLKNYSFFQYFNNDKVIQLFNCLNKIEIYRGDYLYKQNMEADSIYILNSGTFQTYSMVSFSWINDYINYIDYSEKNILQHIIKNKHIKISDLIKIIQNFQKNSQNSMKKIENNELWDKINERQSNDNLYKLKKDEEKLNSPDNIFKINLRKINYNDILGLEEVFEFKKRFYTCKCISEKAELRAIKIIDLIKLIYTFNEEELNYFLHIINERKNILKSQILNGIRNLDKDLIFNFDIRYENIIKSSESKIEEEKSNMLLTALRIKGYKTSIQDILDNNISLFPKEKNNNAYILKKIRRKNKSSAQLMNEYIKQKGTINQFRFNKIQSSFRSEKPKINKKYILNNMINRFQNKTPTSKKILENKRYSILFNSNNISNISKRLKIDQKKNFFELNNNNKNQINNFKDKNKSSVINKIPKKYNLNQNKINQSELIKSISLPEFKTISKINNLSDTTKNSDYINLRHFPLTKKNTEVKKISEHFNNDKTFLKEENGYKTFYNIFNEDKNFFLGAEFQKKLKKEYKLLNSIYNNNIIKEKKTVKNEFFL